MVPEAIVRKVAELEFNLQKQLFEEFGYAKQAFKAYERKGDKITRVISLNFKGDFATSHSSTVQKMLKKHELVATVCEAWITTSRSSIKEEAVLISIYTNEQVWVKYCSIKRNPNTIEDGVLQSPVSLSGRMQTGPLNRNNTNLLQQELEHILRGGGSEFWPEELQMLLGRLATELRDIAPATDVLYQPDIPDARYSTALGLLEKLVTKTVYPPLEEVPVHSEMALLGLNLQICFDRSDISMDPVKSVKLLLPRLSATLSKHEFPVHTERESNFILLGDYLPLSFAHGLKEQSSDWHRGKECGPEFNKRLFAWFLARWSADLELLDQDPFETKSEITIPLLLYIDESNFALDSETWNSGKAIEAALPEIQNSLKQTLSQDPAFEDVGLRFMDVGLMFDALRNKHERRITSTASGLIELSVGLGVPVEQITYTAIPVSATKPTVHDLVMGTLTGGGKILAPQMQQRLPYWSVESYSQLWCNVFSKLGVKESIRGHLVKVDELPVDPLGAPMYPEINGSWFSPISMRHPEALGVLKSMSWDYLTNEDTETAQSGLLPLPHQILRLGAVEMMSRHYTPAVYRILKEELSNPSRNVDASWSAAAGRHAGLSGLLGKLPSFARPDTLVSLTLQLHWTRSPTVKARPQLVELLRFTDITEKLKVQAIAVPFPLFYMHLGFENSVAEIYMGEGEDAGSAFSMTGAFIRLDNSLGERALEMAIVWQVRSDPLSASMSTLRLNLSDENVTVSECVENALVAAESPPETKESERAAAEELLKMVFYMGSREARRVDVKDRSKALKDLGRKNPEQQKAILEKTRALYDHILIGPEKSLFGSNYEGLTGRQVSIHVRRGHLHGYWTGPGRTVYTMRVLEPVVVNRHLLGDGDEPPAPKDYTIH